MAVERFEVQELVQHDAFGLGRVVLVEQDTVTVNFGSGQIRVDRPFHKLSKL